ncbi:hypothetical protein ACTTAF_04795 [Rhodobacter capsulatus]|uniref:hypothetical protein n=1 Tax=Rhodobacter capsulatus TaxID=1061 RepID=UPI0003D34BF3|nr:hypothetical protein [Rhodobacter capsulatus]ETD82231.1 hypothetical protein U703_12965 [Rhodobacter capsulatus YW1]
MSKIDPLFAYFTILAVVQPARIQDIEAGAEQLFSAEYARKLVGEGLLRAAHETARSKSLVLQIRRGVYFTAPTAKQYVRRQGLEQMLDNRRLFLMKAQRRRYK